MPRPDDSHSAPRIVTADMGLYNRVALFRSIPVETSSVYVEECGIRRIAAGETLLAPEEPNTNLYVVLAGAVSVHLNDPSETPLAVLGVGENVGEMSILEGKNPSAWVKAIEDTVLLVIGEETVWAFINASHAFARNLLMTLSSRIRESNIAISDSVVIIRRFRHLSMTDALTGLYNRHWVEQHFRREIELCKSEQIPASFIMLDIDGFKDYNSRFGHLVGDHTLCLVCDALRSNFRPNDMLARYGGDEFVVLLPQANLENAVVVAERVRGAVANIDHEYEAITVSLGVATLGETDSLETLVGHADEALYRAKQSGRNAISVYPDPL
ncbi:MAG: GGDEF domain-containing protein [Gammaproteobacteria bacterium]